MQDSKDVLHGGVSQAWAQHKDRRSEPSLGPAQGPEEEERLTGYNTGVSPARDDPTNILSRKIL